MSASTTSIPSTPTTPPTSIFNKCAACGTSTTLRCSRCKFLTICTTTCFKRIWPFHKSECHSIATAGPPTIPCHPTHIMIEVPDPTTPLPGQTPIFLQGSDLQTWKYIRFHQRWLHRRYGLPDAADNVSTKDYYGALSVGKRVEFFADLMELWDSTSAVHVGKSESLKMVFNQRYNYAYTTFWKNFPMPEVLMLDGMMKERKIGPYWKGLRDRNTFSVLDLWPLLFCISTCSFTSF
ncbi:hypothetical protein HDV00_005801 [Rhizophlyctis rosea]|nr:hypothetical protein HDV00_005801 [Rhizophlyctis rosea]